MFLKYANFIVHNIKTDTGAVYFLVRAKGIEPSSSAWEADVLPLYHARDCWVNFIPNMFKCPV